jgi:hypothetical protein
MVRSSFRLLNDESTVKEVAFESHPTAGWKLVGKMFDLFEKSGFVRTENTFNKSVKST